MKIEDIENNAILDELINRIDNGELKEEDMSTEIRLALAHRRNNYNFNKCVKIDVYSDGSGNTFDSDGGWGFRIVADDKVVQDGKGYLAKATNNVAELNAAIQGLEAAKAYITANNIKKPEVTLISDSQLVLNYAMGTWKCKAIHLAQLRINLQNIYKELSASTKWVKGHNGDEHNEACDLLAKTARENKL